MTRKSLFVLLILIASSASASDDAAQAPPDTVFTSNVSIDILVNPGSVWLATDEGVNFTTDKGVTWLRYDNSNGLAGNNISALGSFGGRIWVASGHTGVVGGENVSLSDGLQFTDDLGEHWQLIDFDAQQIDYATGGDRTIFDITAHNNWVMASGFAAGLLGSNDGGTNWRRMFASSSDSTNYYDGHVGLVEISLQNRQFSCEIDTSHFDPFTSWDDSIFLWTGTAGGLYKMVFADRHVKPQSQYINDIEFCLSCQGSDSNYVFIGGDNGLTRGLAHRRNQNRPHGGPYLSRFASDPSGIPHNTVSALYSIDNTLYIATSDSTQGTAAIAISSDNGETYSSSNSWTGPAYADFVEIGGRLYAANTDSVAVTVDTSITFVEAFGTGANCLTAIQDTMLLGTDSGLIVLTLDAAGTTVDTSFVAFAEDDSTSTKVIDVEIQQFLDISGTIVDSNVIWTVNRPVTVNGHPFVGRYHLDSIGSTAEWQRFLVDSLTFDLDIRGSQVYMSGGKGVWKYNSIDPTSDFSGSGNYFPVYSRLPGYTTDSLHVDTVTTVAISDSLIYFGTKNGFAFSADAGNSFDIRRPNLDPFKPDSAYLYTVANSFLNFRGTTGFISNWVPALEVQYLSNGGSAIWTSNRSTGRDLDTLGFGICRSRYDSIGSVLNVNGVDRDSVSLVQFELYYNDGFAWNFAFYGDTVFAATDAGLIYNTSGEKFDWDTLQFVDGDGVAQILPNIPVYGVAVDSVWLWVATDDRTVRVDLRTLLVDKTFYVSDFNTPADEVYAFPVPFSHTSDYALDFHFVVENDANVTLEIYDFAMNLVRRVIDNQPFAAGIYPTSGAGRTVWDGKNGKGDDVAVGVYYFKVSYSSGEERWGKLAVMP